MVAAAVLAAAGACGGCSQGYYARMLLQPNTSPGKISLRLGPSPAELLTRKEIDAHRRITMTDGTVIDVWVVKSRQLWSGGDPAATRPHRITRATVVLLHGLTESKASYPYPGVAERLAKKGYDVVLPDLRAHGASTGKYVTYGVDESADVQAVVSALIGEGLIDPKIYACGKNLGGTTAILYGAADPRCRGVVAIVPYKDMDSIGRLMIRFHAVGLKESDYQVILRHAGDLANFNPQEASAVEAARKLHCPLLVIHKMLDLSVPADHAEQVYRAAPRPKKLVVAQPLLLPGPEENWIAGQIDMLATGGIGEAPAEAIAPAPPGGQP